MPRPTTPTRTGRPAAAAMRARPAAAALLPRTALAVLLILAAAAGGCNLFRGAVLWFGEQPTRNVPAEYPHLVGRKVCLLVWGEPYTLAEYPDVQLELAEHARVALQNVVQRIAITPNRQVVEYQRTNPNWDRERPADIGQRFGADRVLVIEVTQYTTREPDNPYVLRGRISANVKVYDAAHPDAEPAYKTTLDVRYPPGAAAEYGTRESDLRRATLEAFAGELAGRFYARREQVK